VVFCCAVGQAERVVLFHHPLFSSSRCAQLVIELELPVEIRSLSYVELKSDAFRNHVNPHLTVPVLAEFNSTGSVDALTLEPEFSILESGAIMEYLLDRFPSERSEEMLGGREHRARAKVRQWLHYAPATLYSRAGSVYVHSWEFRRGQKGEHMRDDNAIATNSAWLRAHFVPFAVSELTSAAAASGASVEEYAGFIASLKLTAADIALSWEMMLLEQVGFFDGHPVLQAYALRLRSLASWRRVYPDAIHEVCVWPHDNQKCQELHLELGAQPRSSEL